MNTSPQNPTVVLGVATLSSGSKCPGLVVDQMLIKIFFNRCLLKMYFFTY